MARERFVTSGAQAEEITHANSVPSVVSLVLGAQPGKVYNNLRIISSRLKERF
jgi:hypothetical protein